MIDRQAIGSPGRRQKRGDHETEAQKIEFFHVDVHLVGVCVRNNDATVKLFRGGDGASLFLSVISGASSLLRCFAELLPFARRSRQIVRNSDGPVCLSKKKPTAHVVARIFSIVKKTDALRISLIRFAGNNCVKMVTTVDIR